MRMRSGGLAALALAAALAAGCGGGKEFKSSGSGGGSGSKGSITIGSANFPENVLLAEIYAGALQSKGVKVSKKLNIGSREAVFPAMERGDLALLPEYTGALSSYISKGKAKGTDTQAQITDIEQRLPPKLTLLQPAAAEDKDTVTCRPQVVQKYGLKSIGDLAKVASNLVLGGPPELRTRAGFGLKGLKRVYGVQFKRFQALDVAGPLTVSALKKGKVDCANLFSTQSAIAANGFISLADPKGLVENENVVPLIAKDKATPAVKSALAAVSAKLTTDQLKQLVKRVEVDKDDAGTVAKDWLSEAGIAS